ncbi:MAG: hypothetical protein JOZ93_15915 [Sinobacteraceae bacterium]|nr:hypothetical protein [Nevskiaceae bacterium]
MTAPSNANEPSCNAARNGSADGHPRPACPVCDRPLRSPRSTYCTDACRQRAFRLRHAVLPTVDERQLRAELRRRGGLVAHTLYECGRCGERLVGERRCPDCHVFGRAIGLGGRCHACDQPLLLAELLDLEVLP